MKIKSGLLVCYVGMFSFPLWAESVSICNRSLEVKMAIMNEVEIQRFVKGKADGLNCSSIEREELEAISTLSIEEKISNSLSAEDFKGLKSVFYIDFGKNVVELDKKMMEELPSFKKSQISPLEHSVKSLKQQVRSHYKLPLDIEVVKPTNAEEEALLIRQLNHVGKASRSAAFDFFKVKINFGDLSKVGANYNGMTGELSINISKDGPLVSSSMIEKALASGFKRSALIPWHKSQNITKVEIKEAIDRDLLKLKTLENDLKLNITRLNDMMDAAHSRHNSKRGRIYYTASEIELARYTQLRVMLALHRTLNTLVRWQGPNSDTNFVFQDETFFIRSWGSLIYKTYSDWFLNAIAGNRAVLNITDSSWWHRNSIAVILDKEADEGEINLNGRRSAHIPEGSVKAMMKYRIDQGMKSWLKSMDYKLIVDERLENTRKIAKKHPFSGLRAWKELWDNRIKNTAKFPVYHTVLGVAEWLGDTRVHNYEPSITSEQIREMERNLRPGDILLERQDYFLSNAFLPGFWPHAILYLGPSEEWTSLRLEDGTTLGDDPWIRKNILPQYEKMNNGHKYAVIEAISEGVTFSTMEHAVQKDYIAVLRPTFSEEVKEAKIANAIRRALKHLGRPYDFDFDYASDDKIVCTELIYRSYDPDINFGIQKNAIVKPEERVPGLIVTAGRNTMPANEIARYALYMEDHSEANPKIDYVGKTLEVISVYMKVNPKEPAKAFHGEEAIKELRRSVDL